jgi:RNA polymerase sigma-70 factor (ECF subfamily)
MRNDPPRSRASAADRELHARLHAGDPTAPFDLFQDYAEPLLNWLRPRFRGLDSCDLEEIAFDSVSRLAMEPARYDPERGSLANYLRMDADGDARNALERAKRRAGRELSLEAVELSPSARNSLLKEEVDPVDRIAGREDKRVAREWVEEYFAGSDREIVWLMFERERRTSVFASVLGLEDLPEPEQRREVKRVKDRLKARLKRLGVRVPDDA